MGATAKGKYNWPVHRYEVVAFLSGFSVLVLELSGARLIAPFFGTSTYIWTSIIGVILGALAIGNVIGGRLADKRNPAQVISRVLAIGAAAIVIMGVLQQPSLNAIAALGLDIRLAAFLASVLLFAIPSLLIGVVYPCLAKLQLTSLKLAGQSMGRLEAAGTIGSISGTFVTGYILLGYFGTQTILTGVAVVLLVAAVIAARRFERVTTASLVIITLSLTVVTTNAPGVIADVNTRYARYQVQELLYGLEPVRALVTDSRGLQSAVSVNFPALPVFSYIQRFFEVAVSADKTEKLLIIGGGSFSFPYVLDKNLDSQKVATIDVVEIDEQLERIAQEYFYYQPSKRIKIFNEDGRTFLNREQRQYDIIYLDAFASNSPPFQLTTNEFIRRVKANLRQNGQVVVNLISDYQNGTDDYLRSVVATYKQNFTYVSVYAADKTKPAGENRINIILSATNNQMVAQQTSQSLATPALPVQAGGQILTDNFAPIEKLTY